LTVALFVAGLAGLFGAVPQAAAANQQEYFFNGCYYLGDGVTYTLARCRQTDGSDYYFVPDASGNWVYQRQCILSTNGVLVCLFVDGTYVEVYPDGSKFARSRDGRFVILAIDGTIDEEGFYNANGEQNSKGVKMGRNSQALQSRSLSFQNLQNMNLQMIRQMNPKFFDSMFVVGAGGNQFANCLWTHDSATDFDHDGYTGFYELEEFCRK